tara:strand:+ start:1225 stop:1464 length:240 start_codon:yes stop_codon:yes gene_type:complete
MIDPKQLVDLPHGQAEAVLKREGLWAKKKFKVRVVGRYYAPLETKVVTVKAHDRVSAELKAENMSGFDEINETEIIGEE